MRTTSIRTIRESAFPIEHRTHPFKPGYKRYRIKTVDGIDPPCVISLAKREEEVFLPGRSEPLRLSRDSYSLRLLEYVRRYRTGSPDPRERPP